MPKYQVNITASDKQTFFEREWSPRKYTSIWDNASARSSLTSHDVSSSAPTFLQLTGLQSQEPKSVCWLLTKHISGSDNSSQQPPYERQLKKYATMNWFISCPYVLLTLLTFRGQMKSFTARNENLKKDENSLPFRLVPTIYQVLLTCRSSRTSHRRTPCGWSPS
jgi:hypothetical protein